MSILTLMCVNNNVNMTLICVNNNVNINTDVNMC